MKMSISVQVRKKSLFRSFLAAATILAGSYTVRAHPHVFVDGGFDFVVSEAKQFTAIRVTWRYDAFETLYMLSEMNVSLAPSLELSDSERELVEATLSSFPPDFDGSVHISLDGSPVALQDPRNLTARMIGDRLEITFLRDLKVPVGLRGQKFNIGFYERTYFFAFSLSDIPDFGRAADHCSYQVTPYDTSAQSDEVLQELEKLGREETPEDSNIGATLADRMVVSCF
ncbi:DUF1007 family protein [Cognatishimia sp. D5M38]|jgi:ABC-type uncharacterized transport system substrate-binding protein|uniref:DUF1007 family protein n=1 Tax=Cognatishimia coralii TaxID=3083254 RepID=A0ABU8QGQ1_9RHOB